MLKRLLPGLLIFVAIACEHYDPPPSVELVPAAEGRYEVGHDVLLQLSEPVATESLALSAWCKSSRDIEGNFPQDGQGALSTGCVPAMCPEEAECGPFNACVDEEGQEVRLRFREASCSEDKGQLWVMVEPGLSDLLGNETGVNQAFSFMLWPEESSEESVDTDTPLELASGVVTLISSLAEGNENIAAIYPSLYLRLLMDVIVASESGEVWLLATVARLTDEAKEQNATSDVPTERLPIVDSEGWAVLIKGSLRADASGGFALETLPTDVTVWVLGSIKVVLMDFQLRGLVFAGDGEGGRDSLAGELTTSEAEITLGGPSNLGAVNAIFSGEGLFLDEVPSELPRLCSDDPCKSLEEQGGDCQVPLPWQVPEPCP